MRHTTTGGHTPSASDDELLREIVGAAAHDLGGLSSAIAMRAEALGTTASPGDARAFEQIAQELRLLGRQLRHLRGPRGTESLAPSEGGTLPAWFALIERFGRALLGSGIALRGTMAELRVTPVHAHLLSYAVLALCRDVYARRRAMRDVRTVVSVEGVATPTGIAVTMRVTDDGGAAGSLRRRRSRWHAYARRVAERGGASFVEDRDTTTIVVPHVS